LIAVDEMRQHMHEIGADPANHSYLEQAAKEYQQGANTEKVCEVA
jgi:hypothetical protein